MTYQSIETSQELGQPVELYQFVKNGVTTHYTNYFQDLTIGSNVFKTANIKRTNFEISSGMDNAGLSLTMPIDDDFSKELVGVSDDYVTTVTISRGHSTNPAGTYVVYWKGRIVTTEAMEMSVKIVCESVFTSLKRSGVRARFQKSCRHALYSSTCKVNPEAYGQNATLTSVNGVTLTVPVAANQPDGWYVGGMLKASNGAFSFIVRHSGASLTISRQSGFIEDYMNSNSTMPVVIYPGCDRNRGDTGCGKFNNLLNFGGFPWMPSRNPLGGKSIL